MILVVDVGNTHATCGVWRGSRLIRRWAVPTERPPARLAERIIRGVRGLGIDGAAVSSVVPWVDRSLTQAIRRRCRCRVVFADAHTTGVPLAGYIKEEVGADRLVNALAGYRRYSRPLIIVDFGTATTFDVVGRRGEFLGGAIAPGIHLANRSLFDYTAKLPAVPVKRTSRIIGHTTVTSMQAGVFHGYVGLVEHLIARTRREMRAWPRVIATGGLARLIASSTDAIEAVYPDLTLEGLRLVWELNGD